jgi:Outer membrane efflux protein
MAVNKRYIGIAKNNLRVADFAFRQQVIATVSGVVGLYWDLASLNEDVRVRQDAVASAEQFLSDNKNQIETGTVAPVDVTRAQAELSRRKRDLAVARSLVRGRVPLRLATVRNWSAAFKHSKPSKPRRKPSSTRARNGARPSWSNWGPRSCAILMTLKGNSTWALNLPGTEQKMAAHSIVIPRNGNLHPADLESLQPLTGSPYVWGNH